MRLFEVASRFEDDLLTALHSVIGKRDSLTLSYNAMSNILKNLGYGHIDYRTFNHMYDTMPALQELVKDFNETHIELAPSDSSDEKSEQTPASPEPESVTGNSSTVQSAARSANPYT